ncbi:hypothetical protein P152DRAFT_459361 [Eremomyces bilateralis CBS 781.70]|uniref:Uncharacterized protein n=1 Tax=Eremomyces bilateralis CBS 781.70 TaxID=1392243 RepID=A0A6G1G0T6_9PEZI|nr:uncharacterized protein P152DRAFT_459361 [Eremomyces bilateralis CBS 781.70]KAF1811419.1 hypothetical protein P152DRAFT_459361 [Eremomyces bilateralis CBS 781.70]
MHNTHPILHSPPLLFPLHLASTSSNSIPLQSTNPHPLPHTSQSFECIRHPPLRFPSPRRPAPLNGIHGFGDSGTGWAQTALMLVSPPGLGALALATKLTIDPDPMLSLTEPPLCIHVEISRPLFSLLAFASRGHAGGM